MADTDIPKFKTYAEGEPIPPVDPDDIKRMWEYESTHSRVGANGCQWLQGMQAALSPGADFSDVSSRHGMVYALAVCGQLLAPWDHGGELHEAVFRIAATFPLHELKHKPYMIEGDEHFGFDPNAFVQRLIEETGVSHVWEPVATKVPEGGRGYTTVSATIKGQGPPDPEREAKRKARDLLWEIWSRFAHLGDLMPLREKWTVSRTTELFDNFVITNDDLLREVESGFRTGNGDPLEILTKVEQRAQRFPR
jgi:hypothetical protein